ncbi:threonine synthase [Paraferrimonas haliotis]|uniref:threonine synthase n=1 Tax=Paraferrimonas haliotis TaxID=2013866 RepID=UPI000BA99A47|nr:threonine synthase [Paraferrimonas haliotis]
MELFNLKHPQQKVNFQQALTQGLGKDRGLFFPTKVPTLSDIEELLTLPFVERSQQILGAWLAAEIGQTRVDSIVENAFNFELPLQAVTEQTFCLELFHGPTLAFKDFGARFMAQCLSQLNPNRKITILTATSGDTGAAVADAFYGLDNVQVVILYPKGRISELQEKMFCTLGGNIATVAIDGDFDQCQALVKLAFEDQELKQALSLNSANSINISRLLAQICYYFEGVALLNQGLEREIVISVPSGNFGNITAGLLGKAMGLPVERFVAATNINDTVPRYWNNGHWQVNATQATASNAMDVSDPSNWPRAQYLMEHYLSRQCLQAISVDEAATLNRLKTMHQQGYVSEPHAAVAAQALEQGLAPHQLGIFLGTAHPSKFKQSVEQSLAIELALPKELAAVVNKPLLSHNLAADYQELRHYLFDSLLSD